LVDSRSSTPTSHSFPQTLSPLAASSTSLGSSGRSVEVTGRRGSLLPRQTAASAASRARRREVPRLGLEDVPRMARAEVPRVAPSASASRHRTMFAATVVSLATGLGTVDSHDTARPTSHRRRRRSQLCSWHTQASSYLQRHRPQRLSSTLTSQRHVPFSATAPVTTRPTGGASTPVPPTT
jgi:hypothetical protein